MSNHSYGSQTTAVLAFQAAWQATRTAHAAWNALDEDEQQALLDQPDAPEAALVSRTLMLAEQYGLTLNSGRPDDDGDDEAGRR